MRGKSGRQSESRDQKQKAEHKSANMRLRVLQHMFSSANKLVLVEILDDNDTSMRMGISDNKFVDVSDSIACIRSKINVPTLQK